MKGQIRKSKVYNGKRYWARGSTEAEAYQNLAIILEKVRRGEIIVESDMTLDQWFEVCVNTYKPKQKEITKEKYKGHYKNEVGKFLGQKALKDIKPIDCQNVLNSLADKSASTINQAYQTMRFLFRQAVANELLLKDPTLNIVRPKGYKKERRPLNAKEQAAANKLFADNSDYLLFELMLKCGCRPDEAAEVKGGDAVTKEGFKYLHIRGTKNDRADRLVPCPDDLFKKISAVDPWTYVAPDPYGNRRSETSRRNLWKNFKKDMNVALGARIVEQPFTAKDGKIRKRDVLVGVLPFNDEAIVPYSLRHTYCVNAVLQGVDIVTLMYMMGHSDTSMIAKVYSHYTDDMLKKASIQLRHIK